MAAKLKKRALAEYESQVQVEDTERSKRLRLVVGGSGIDDTRIFAVLLDNFRTDDCMTILVFFISCFTEIVKEPCAFGDRWVQPNF